MSIRHPHVVVCAGGGGVGKTTTSAALGLALARLGACTLVVTIDPARRLADALGVSLGNDRQIVRIDPTTEDRLSAIMPDPEFASRLFMEYLFADEPEAFERLRENAVFRTLEDKLVGMSELVAMTLVLRALDEGGIDIVVIDTAPSRYALDFLTYPARLASLLEGRALKWLSALAERSDDNPKKRRFFSGWGKRTAERALGAVIGGELVLEVAQIFSEMGLVRKRFAEIAKRLGKLLLGDTARYVLVAAPTGAARDDVGYLLGRLAKLHQQPVGIVLNRSERSREAWTSVLRDLSSGPAVRETLDQLDEERSLRQAATETFARALSDEHPYLHQITLQQVEDVRPVAIVTALAAELQPHASALAGYLPT